MTLTMFFSTSVHATMLIFDLLNPTPVPECTAKAVWWKSISAHCKISCRYHRCTSACVHECCTYDGQQKKHTYEQSTEQRLWPSDGTETEHLWKV